jgi:hypothetical protein
MRTYANITMHDEFAERDVQVGLAWDITGVFVRLPDGREVWIEPNDDKLKVHAYDTRHDTPITLWIGVDDVEVINDR